MIEWLKGIAPGRRPAIDAAARRLVGEIGELSIGAVGDVAVWSLQGPRFAGAIADPIEAWLRCGPLGALHTIVNGRFVVRDGRAVHDDLPEMLRRHESISARLQRLGS